MLLRTRRLDFSESAENDVVELQPIVAQLALVIMEWALQHPDLKQLSMRGKVSDGRTGWVDAKPDWPKLGRFVASNLRRQLDMCGVEPCQLGDDAPDSGDSD